MVLPVGVPPRSYLCKLPFFSQWGFPHQKKQKPQENPKFLFFPTSQWGFPHEREMGFTFFSPSEGSPAEKTKKPKKTQKNYFYYFSVEVPSQGSSFFRNLGRGEVTPQKNSHLFRWESRYTINTQFNSVRNAADSLATYLCYYVACGFGKWSYVFHPQS